MNRSCFPSISLRLGLLLLLLAMAGGCVAPTKPVAAADKPMLVFLLIGQSNMAGRGVIEDEDRKIHPRVFMLTQEKEWAPALDPLHFDKPDRTGVGLGSTFGRVVADRRPGNRIGLVPAAFGGTSLDKWEPGGELYTAAVERARVAMRSGRLAGILWHQGEADRAPEKAATYLARFQRMITQLRHDLGAPDVPVIVGEIGQFREENAAINAAIATIPAHVPRSALVTAEGMTHKGDRTHFDARSLRLFGHRYADAWLTLVQRDALSPP